MDNAAISLKLMPHREYSNSVVFYNIRTFGWPFLALGIARAYGGLRTWGEKYLCKYIIVFSF